VKFFKFLYYRIRGISIWEEGICRLRPARRHKILKNVQFVLWKAGEQGHKKDCWVNFDSTWWPQFEREE